MPDIAFEQGLKKLDTITRDIAYDVPALKLTGQKVESNIVVDYTDDRGRAQVRVGDEAYFAQWRVAHTQERPDVERFEFRVDGDAVVPPVGDRAPAQVQSHVRD